ncbi:MAG: nuclear transport factor 2 family protein [Acidobacteriota bacterium]|nr:nuclear transport factor 2 family protein [Acidobacteriota bacterium]
MGKRMQTVSEDNLNLVRNVYKAADISQIIPALSPDFEIYQTELLPWGGHYQGLTGAQQFFTRLRQNVDSAVEIEEVFPVAEKVVVKGRTRGKVLRNHNKFDVSVVHIWTLRDGKLIKFEPLIDTPSMLAALN